MKQKKTHEKRSLQGPNVTYACRRVAGKWGADRTWLQRMCCAGALRRVLI